MIPNFGVTEIIIILAIVLLLFGSRRIPGLARALGAGLREFRNGISEKNEKGVPGEELPPDKSARLGQEA